jgi:hypothetical protein
MYSMTGAAIAFVGVYFWNIITAIIIYIKDKVVDFIKNRL